jgi:hypothetical protein
VQALRGDEVLLLRRAVERHVATIKDEVRSPVGEMRRNFQEVVHEIGLAGSGAYLLAQVRLGKRANAESHARHP